MVYSTCTFNPIEDEAVVAELLVRCGGSLQLLDVSKQLPELKRLPGKRKWRVRDKFRWYDTWEEAEKVREPALILTTCVLRCCGRPMGTAWILALHCCWTLKCNCMDRCKGRTVVYITSLAAC